MFVHSPAESGGSPPRSVSGGDRPEEPAFGIAEGDGGERAGASAEQDGEAPGGVRVGGGFRADTAQRLRGDGVGGAVEDERGQSGAAAGLEGGEDALLDQLVVGAAEDDGADVPGVSAAAAATARSTASVSAYSTASASPGQGTSVTSAPSAKSRMSPRW